MFAINIENLKKNKKNNYILYPENIKLIKYYNMKKYLLINY